MPHTDPLLHLDTVPAFIRDMPKAELHVHVEGTIEGDMVIDLAERNGVDLPFKTAEDVRAVQNQSLENPHNNLANFLRCLDFCRSVLRRGEDFHEVAMAFFRRCQASNVVYVETMFDVQEAIKGGVPVGDHFEALLQAGRDAERDLGVQVQWIMNFQRDHPIETALPALEQADPWREHIAGVGLDNFEVPGFPQKFDPLFNAARRRGYRLTSHCDVNQPDTHRHIRDCIELLGVSRIDHGLNVAQSPELIEIVIDKQIGLTGCPTFMRSQGASASDRIEMLKTLLDAGALISVNSDDPAQFASGYLCTTLTHAQKAADLTDADVVKLMTNAFQSSWLPDNLKQSFISRVQDYASVGASSG